MATGRQLISSSSSSCKVGGSEDLVVEILSRLPGPKPAFRCKSVCKLWNSVISTPYFPRRFISRRRTLSAAAEESEQAVLTESQVLESIKRFIPFPGEIFFKKFSADFSKDLLFLGFWGQETSQELSRTYLVCNPFTKQWVALPLAPAMSVRLSPARWTAKLVSDNSRQGEAPVFPCRFRLLRMYAPAESSSSQVNLFCSRSGRWTKFVVRVGYEFRHCFGRSIPIVSDNGKLYLFEWKNMRVLAWDIRKKELRLLTYQDEEIRFLTSRYREPFHPTVTLWPSVIPSPEKSAYNGSYKCWFPPHSQNQPRVKLNHLCTAL